MRVRAFVVVVVLQCMAASMWTSCGGVNGPTRVQLIKVDRNRFENSALGNLSKRMCDDLEGWFAAAVLIELGESGLGYLADVDPPACAAAQPRWWDRMTQAISLVGRFQELTPQFRQKLLEYSMRLHRTAPDATLRASLLMAAMDVNRFKGRTVLLETVQTALTANELTAANPILKQALRATWDLQRNPAMTSTLLEVARKSSDPFIRYQCAIGIGSVGEDQTIVDLKALLDQESDPLVRIGLNCSLYRRCSEANEDPGPFAEFLNGVMSNGKTRTERVAIAECVTLARLPDAEKHLLARVQADDRPGAQLVREEWIGLGLIGADASRQWLLKRMLDLAKDRNDKTLPRLMAIVEALGNSRDSRVRVPILEMLPTRNGELFFRIREAATRLYRDQGGDPPVHVPEFLVPVPSADDEEPPLPSTAPAAP